MILDRLDRFALYTVLGDRLARGLLALREAALHERPDGKYAIDGEDVFAMVQRYTTRPPEQGRWEAHRQYIDIQYIAAGVERMGRTDLDRLKVVEPYDAARDVMFLAGDGDIVTVRAGEFVIFHPQDAHMPGLADGGPGAVTKVVVKVRVG
jgi:biofilm protein TabA